MTRVNKLTLRGFKSFANKTDLVFEGQYNCVLGPNGSGKSNILDGICFVLGKTSAKSMRAEKSSNLIYNGGKKKRPAKEAEVSIVFDNKSRIFPEDSDEIKVSRIVRTNGQSLYKINDIKKSRQEIIELLSMAKIDPDGYNIILQGDILRFVEMPPVERRQLVEEIAGISIYEEKKQKALNELQKVEEKLGEAEIVLKERESTLKELKKDRDQALKYKELKSKIDTNKASYLQILISQKEENLKQIDEQLEKLQKEYDTVMEKINKSKKEIEDKRNEIDSINKELEEKGTKEQTELQQKIQVITVDIAKLKQQSEHLDKELERVEERRKSLNLNLEEIKEKAKKLTDEQQELEELYKKNGEQFMEVEARLKKFKEKHKLDSANSLEQEMQKIDYEIEDMQKNVTELREKQQDVLREKDRLEVQLEVVDEKINKVLLIKKENKEKIEDLKQKKTEFKKTTLELNKCLNDDSSIAAQVKTARERSVVQKERLEQLRAKTSSIKELISGSDAIRAILEAKNEIPGVLGTVSELGEVNSKYGLALEVAAGTHIKSIVVENDAVASKCIKFLKTRKLGIATFLPLNKIRPPNIAREAAGKLKQQVGVHGLAVDLVSYDMKYKKVFEFVFGNTVVVDNIEVARKIGVGRAKMVTLEGDLCEVSGAMRGGFRQKARGVGFMQKEIASEMKDLEASLADVSAVLSRLEEKKVSNEEAIYKLRDFKAHLEGDIITLEKTLNLDSGDMDASKDLKKEINAKLKELDKDINAMQDKISEANVGLAKKKSEKEVLRGKLTQLKSPTLLAELAAFEDKRQEIKEKLIKLDSERKRVQNQLDAMIKPEQDKINLILDQITKEEEIFKSDQKSTIKRIAELEKEHAESVEHQKKFFSQFKQYYEKRDKLNDVIRKEEKRLENLHEDLRKVDQRTGKVGAQRATIDTEYTALKREFEPYKDVELDTSKSEGQLKKEINAFERMVDNLGNINLKALDVYDDIATEYETLMTKKEKLRKEREDVLLLMNEIETRKIELFMKTFEVVHLNFQNIFAELSTKGQAELELENPESPFEGGLRVKVKISGNKFMDIRSLSGGEKSMTALAFIFAIQEHDPASFYVLDEVDAALDKRNAQKLAALIKKYSDRAQYIVISHNDEVISDADRLFGISMNEHGMSAVTSLRV